MGDEIDVPELESASARQSWARRTLVTFDQFLNAAAGGAPDDTISSRMQRWKIGDAPKPNKAKKIVGSFMCKWLGLIQMDHDVKANVGDMERARLEEQRTERTLEDSGVNPDA